MRFPLRSFATLMLAIGVATCADSPTTIARPGTDNGSGSSVARLAFEPVFSKAAAETFARLADFGIDFDHVRLVIVRPPSETVKDTVIAFKPGQATLTLDLNVAVRTPGELFTLSMDYTNAQGVVVFHGAGTVRAHASGEAAPPQQITIEYKGPGFNVARVALSPKTPKVIAPATTSFTVAAFDANNAPLTNVPISWTTSDATVATITPGTVSNTATLTPTGKRGTVTVTALTPVTGVSDNTSVVISLPATSIALVSGGGQTGKAGGALAQPAVVRVLANDGVGVEGATVNFAAPAGGKVAASSVTTDATGAASTSLTLGGALGPQSFIAAAGNFNVTIPATATAGDAAAITAISGAGQADTVRHALKNPLVAKVTDAFGNPVPNVTVSWTRAGAGALGAASSSTGTDGLASVGYTLGATVGTETITATVAGVTTPATFAVQAVSAVPAAIAAVSGANQTGRAGQALASPFVVHVVDDAGNPVNGAIVNWTVTNGTLPTPRTTTDTAGNTSNTLTLGANVGTASATATVGTKSVTFTAVVQVGIVAKAVFRTNPPAGAVNQALTPAVQIELQDAAGNLTQATNPVTISLGTNPANGILSGTLTRAAVAGVATFDDLALNANGTYTLIAASGGIANVTSAQFNVGTGSPTLQLIDPSTGTAITGTPTVTLTAGVVPPANAPVIRVVSAANVPLAGVPITINIAGPVATSVTLPTDSVGILRFIGSIRLAGSYTVTATGTGLLGTPRSATVTVLPAPPVQLNFPTVPTNIQPGVASSYQVVALDSIGNVVNVGAGSTLPVTVTISSGPPGSTISNGGPVNAVAGVASFPALTLSLAGAYILRASSPGVGDAFAEITAVTAPASMVAVAPLASTTVTRGAVSVGGTLTMASGGTTASFRIGGRLHSGALITSNY